MSSFSFLYTLKNTNLIANENDTVLIIKESEIGKYSTKIDSHKNLRRKEALRRF